MERSSIDGRPSEDNERKRAPKIMPSLSFTDTLENYRLHLENNKDLDPMKMKKSSFKTLRGLVSQKKKRFNDSFFDLDLSYITERVIAMGFPAENIESKYRNPMKKVQQFLEKYHADHYKVYNLCSEKDYDPSKFNGKVAKFPFDDHGAPTLQLVADFVEDLSNWLDADPQNVGVVHCKAGKGRTGLMISAFLVHRYHDKGADANEALSFYAERRTSNKKGVTIPSQLRFVYYFADIAFRPDFSWKTYVPPTRKLRCIRLHTIPSFDLSGGCSPFFVITCANTSADYNSQNEGDGIPSLKGNIDVEFKTKNVVLKGEFKVEFFDKGFSSTPMFHFWVHTEFVNDDKIVLQRNELDGKAKSSKHKDKFREDFRVEVIFDPPSS